MNQLEIGKLIAEARKEKGYTQQELADLLFITDKAVSKWERGLSLPDSNMFSKIAHFLDLDVEDLIPTNKIEKWSGYIRLDEKDGIYKKMLGNQTVFEHLISFFMLLSIKEIYVDCNDVNFVKNLNLEQYGFILKINSIKPTKKIICIFGNFFLFGANLTRFLTSLMILETSIDFYYQDQQIPISMICGERKHIKKFGRGFLFSNITSENFHSLDKFVKSLSALAGYDINLLIDIFKIRNK